MDEKIIGLLNMIHFIKDPIKDFKKSTYEGMFREFEAVHEETLYDLKVSFSEAEDKEKCMYSITEKFVCQIAEELGTLSKKRKMEQKLTDYNMILVTYIFPAIIDKDKENGMAFAEQIASSWKKQFPQTDIKPASFETIDAGFKQRYCYITTAVCESLGKPDDCYELNLLRDYRDHYLYHQSNGAELIRRYYDIAPTIVKRINRRPDSSRIYNKIWERYLKPCITFIEEKNMEGCMKCYTDMVYDLQKKYFDR